MEKREKSKREGQGQLGGGGASEGPGGMPRDAAPAAAGQSCSQPLSSLRCPSPVSKSCCHSDRDLVCQPAQSINSTCAVTSLCLLAGPHNQPTSPFLPHKSAILQWNPAGSNVLPAATGAQQPCNVSGPTGSQTQAGCYRPPARKEGRVVVCWG